MKLTFIPVRRDETLTLTRAGDVLTINGEDFDFSALPEGATLPYEAIASDWIAGNVTRLGGVLSVPLILPHGAHAPEATRFATGMILTGDGPVDLPDYDEEAPE